MKIGSISTCNSYLSQKNKISKNQNSTNVSFGNYDRKYDWCSDNPLIAKNHPAIICQENRDFENMEIANEMYSNRIKLEQLCFAISKFVSKDVSFSADKINEIIRDFDLLYTLASTKIADNGKIESFSLTNKSGKQTECKFDLLGNLRYTATGVSKENGKTTIDELNCYTEREICKYKKVVYTEDFCSFDEGFTSEGSRSFKFYPTQHNRECAKNDILGYLKS